MQKMPLAQASNLARVTPSRGRRGWQRWTPYAAVGWSLLYGALGIYWATGGRGFPYASETLSSGMASLLARLGPVAAWAAVVLAGLPAAGLGVAMLRGVGGRVGRPLLVVAGALLAGLLLLLMPDLNLLVLLGYVPYAVFCRFTAEKGLDYLVAWTQWATIHQLLCLLGGFLWLAATVCYSRQSASACLACGRRASPEGWTSPAQAARWGRAAVFVSLVAPVCYALTRLAWALGIPLGMTTEYLRRGQASGMWVSGLFLASFGLVGAALTLGLVQRWGEVFPRWMLGLAGRRVPIALAVVPAALVSVLLVVGGLVIASSLGQMAATLAASDIAGPNLVAGLLFQIGPTLLFPLWGVALAVATLGYYYRRRGHCGVCGRGAAPTLVVSR